MNDPDLNIRESTGHTKSNAKDARGRKWAEKWSSFADRAVEAWSGPFIINTALVVFSGVVLLLAALLIVKAFRSGEVGDVNSAMDFLAYVLPCFAGLAGGYAIYEKDVERPLFALSFQFLAAAVAIYTMAHVPGGAFIGLVLCVALIVPLVLLVIEALKAKWHGRQFVKVIVWIAISTLIVISALYLWRVFDVASR